MKFFLPLTLLGVAMAQPPITWNLGTIEATNTEFNVGDGSTDESGSFNHIRIGSTHGTDDGVGAPDTAAGSIYYKFDIREPGCVNDYTDAANVISVNAAYNTDGYSLGVDTVDLELLVKAWETTVFDAGNDQDIFEFCLQADIAIRDGSGTEMILQSKYFDFDVDLVDLTFSVVQNTDVNEIAKAITGDETSGTTISASWLATTPLPPGEPIWFSISADNALYNVSAFEEVKLEIAGVNTTLITGRNPVDAILTSTELSGDQKTLNFYHVLTRDNYAATEREIKLTGSAVVAYAGVRRLRGQRDLQVDEETEFQMIGILSADDGEDGQSSGFKIKVLELVVGGVGLAAAALI